MCIISHITECLNFFFLPYLPYLTEAQPDQKTAVEFCMYTYSYKTRRCFIQIRSWAGQLLLIKHGYCYIKMQSSGFWSGSNQWKSINNTHNSCNWLVVEYLCLSLNGCDQREKTLLSSVIYLPGPKNNCFWSYNSYVGPDDSSIMAVSWETENRKKKKTNSNLWFSFDFIYLHPCVPPSHSRGPLAPPPRE